MSMSGATLIKNAIYMIHLRDVRPPMLPAEIPK